MNLENFLINFNLSKNKFDKKYTKKIRIMNLISEIMMQKTMKLFDQTNWKKILLYLNCTQNIVKPTKNCKINNVTLTNHNNCEYSFFYILINQNHINYVIA